MLKIINTLFLLTGITLCLSACALQPSTPQQWWNCVSSKPYAKSWNFCEYE